MLTVSGSTLATYSKFKGKSSTYRTKGMVDLWSCFGTLFRYTQGLFLNKESLFDGLLLDKRTAEASSVAGCLSVPSTALYSGEKPSVVLYANPSMLNR